jgi:4-oxalocrotonate tautomerase
VSYADCTDRSARRASAGAQGRLIRRVTEAVVAALDVRPEQVRVLLSEVPPEHWAIGGQTMAERAALASRTVQGDDRA